MNLFRPTRPPRLFNLALAFALLLPAPLSALAQQDAARLEGVVRDANGAAVPDATVTVRSTAQGNERTAQTNADGIYIFQQLRAGTYKLAVTHQGFRTSQVPDLVLGVGQARTLDVTLEIGELTDEVTVTAGAEGVSVDTSSNRLGVNVTAQEVEALPVNGRNYSQLYLTAPGAVNTGTGNFDNVRFNGRSNEQNQSKLDGVENTAIFDASPGYLTVQGSQFRLQTSLENVQEFRVDSSNYPAEYGTGTGGQINIIGKSGSNEYHGALFHYFRNDALDARNFFDAERKSPLRLNQFGGSFGGRIVRDKLFFFTSFEGLRQRAGFNVIELTPSDYVREFIASGGTARRAELGISAAAATEAAARVAALRDLGVVNAFPAGSGARLALGGVANGAQFVQTNRTARLDENAFSLRFDGRAGPRFNWFARYQQDPGELVSPDGTTGRLLVATQKARHFVGQVQQIFGTNVINEVKFGVNHSPTTLATVFPDTGSGIDFSSVSINLSGSIVQPGINGGSPTGVASPGGLTRQSSAGNGRAQPIDAVSYSLIDNLAWTRGSHGMKFGGEVRLVRVDFDQLGGTQLTYGNLLDFVLNRNLTGSFIGDLSAPGDFRIATNPVTTFSRPAAGFHRGRQNYLIWYAQDEWRVRPNVTLNFGLRYEYYSPNREADDRAILFDAATGRLLDPSQNELYTAKKGNFGPRLGLTWAPARFNNRTVIRLGGGIYYGPGQYEDLIQPIESDVFRTTRSGLTLGPTTLATIADTSRVQTAFTPRAYDVTGYRVPERVGQYGVSVQQELPGDTLLTVGYVGSQGRNLFQRSITNRILPGQTVIQSGSALPAGVGVVNLCSVAPSNGACPGQIVGTTTVREFDILGFAVNQDTGVITPNPASRLQPFGEIDYKTSGGRDSYNALQVTINRRFAQGLTLGGQYTWGHSVGTTQGSNEANTTQDPYDFNQERGNNTWDIRHSGNLSLLYQLPFGRGRRFGVENGFADALFGGWQIGGVFNARSGIPLNVLLTRADVVIECAREGGCPTGVAGQANIARGTVGRLPSTVNAANPLPPGFVAVLNTPGGNASRNTRRPDYVAGADPVLSDGGLRYLNPAAFAIPRPGSYGNLSRNAIHGPEFRQLDLTFQKRFNLTERVNVEFRTEVYNILNRANFANPPAVISENLPNITFNSGTGVTAVGSGLQPGQAFGESQVGNFGVINSTVGRTVGLGTNRQLQFALRLNF